MLRSTSVLKYCILAMAICCSVAYAQTAVPSPDMTNATGKNVTLIINLGPRALDANNTTVIAVLLGNLDNSTNVSDVSEFTGEIEFLNQTDEENGVFKILGCWFFPIIPNDLLNCASPIT